MEEPSIHPIEEKARFATLPALRPLAKTIISSGEYLNA